MVVKKESKQNIFSRSYNYLENQYIKMSDWLTEKGIPLNNLNDYLEKKGLPAFAVVISFLLLLILLILFIIFFISAKYTLVFDFKDYQNNPVTNVYVSIYNDQDKEIFSGIVENNSSRKVKLRLGDTYFLRASKDNFPEYTREILITEREQEIFIVFDELVEYGILNIKLKDRENQRTISSGKVTAIYNVNNQRQESESFVDIFNDHFITLELPLNKDIELLVRADNYEDFRETNFRMAQKTQERIIELDISRLDFQGNSQLTFVVLDNEENLVTGAEVSVFNTAGDELANQTTIDGRALFNLNMGDTISYIIKKEGYKTHVSDDSISYRLLNLEETVTVVLEPGGNFIEVTTRSSQNHLALDDVLVTLYNTNNTVIDSGRTDDVGYIKFEGINVSDKKVIVLACKQDYLCSHEIVDLDQISEIDFVLDRIDISNSSILNVFVVDGKNMPVTEAHIKIYSVLDDDFKVPYNTSLKTDLSGSLSIPLRVDKTYRVFAYVGDTSDFEDITISPSRENKIIFVIDAASKLLKLDLYDEYGNKITSGHLLIKAKDGTVLYDDAIIEGESIIFNTKGYNDFIAEITDDDFNITSTNFSAKDADSDGYIRLDVKKDRNVSDFPIIEFIGVLDDRGNRTSFMTPNKDYFLIFDVLFPEDVFYGEVHVRAGDDTQTDSEIMTYGITGFSSIDSSSFKYGTTYNPEPLPGRQSIDLLNQGSSQVLNKWLELYYRDDFSLGNKQIRVKVRAVDSTHSKLIFNYRVLFKENDLYYRDPIDPVLNQRYSTSEREALYAETKKVEIDLFDVPLDCIDDFCVSYKFIDLMDNEFSLEDFFAIKGQSYLLEKSIFSFKNNQINVLAETSRSFPLISFNGFFDTRYQNIFPDTFNNILEARKENLSITSGALNKIYLSFIANEIGTSYIDLKSKGVINDDLIYEDRLSFNVYDEREMRVVFNPDIFVPYGSNFTIDVFDRETNQPIENAFISFYDERESFISSLKGEGSVGRDGRYSIENRFNVSKVLVSVESYGFVPFKKEIFIVDDTLLTIDPREVFVNLGLDQITAQTSFTLFNNAQYSAENIRFGEPVWVTGSNQINIEVRGHDVILKNSNQVYDLIVLIPNNLNFETAYAYVPIYARIGSREVSKIIPVKVNKGLIFDQCVEITPYEVNSFVGLNLKHVPPDLYNTPFQNYDYSGFDTQQNPMLAPHQANSSFYDHLESQNYTMHPTQNPNTLTYTDPNFYTYYSSQPTTTQESTENTTFFIIKNNCNQAITFTPQAQLKSSVSNNDLELSMGHVTVLPGEEKVYDIIIKNRSNRTQPTSYSYDILWHNNFYSISPSTLNIDLLDLSRALWIVPDFIQVPISQLHPQQSALNFANFTIKNIGTVPITDIQISQHPKVLTSNIQITEFPREIPVLNPGQTMNVTLQFRVNIARSTMENRLITVTGRAVGVNDPIYANTQLLFTISSPNCLKVSNKNIDFSLRVGESRTRSISVTNHCMEAVSIVGIDKKEGMYTETFGQNPFKITPATGNNFIRPNETVRYNLELTAESLGGSPKMPTILLGRLVNSQNPVSSEEFTVSVNIEDLDQHSVRDQDVSIISNIPICEDPTEFQTINRPIVSSGNCSETSGYCDAYTSSEFILRRINDLSNQIKLFSSQAQARTDNTGCSYQDLQRGFCRISELGPINPVEFTLYMQNDKISIDLVRHVLSKSNYDFKNYLVEINPYASSEEMSALGVYAAGNKILVSTDLTGCGRYRIEIDGFVAASHDFIYPDRAYYYINVIDYEKTAHCEKNIINYLNYLPWNQPLSKTQREGTWLTLFTGNESLAMDLIKGVGKFGRDPVQRFVFGREHGALNNNLLNVSVDEIKENPEALAKITFNDTRVRDRPYPEQINVILNKLYEIEGIGVSETVSRNFVNAISSMIVKNEYLTEVCISENKEYMLILKTIEAGDLSFVNRDVQLKLTNTYSCIDLKLRSSIDEVLKITSEKIPGLEVGFRENEDSEILSSINLNIFRNEEKTLTVCARAENINVLSSLVGEKVEVLATSIYSGTGQVGLRDARANINFLSCGITPEKLLDETYKQIITEHNKGLDQGNFPQVLYGLVDWTSSYSSNDTEDLCASIEKFITSENYNERLFFNHHDLGCNIPDPSQRTTSKWNKGLTNSGSFFATCFGTCALCTMGMNAAISWIPVLGQVALLKGIVLDCAVFACGLPAAGILANTVTDGKIVEGIDNFLGRILGNENITPLASTVSVFGNALQKIGTAFAGIHAGVSTSKEGLLTLGNIEAIDKLPSATDVVSPTPTPTPRPVPSDLTRQMNRYLTYMDGTSTTFKFTPPPRPGAENFDSLLNKISTRPGGAGTARVFNPAGFQALTPSEVRDLTSYLGDSGAYKPLRKIPSTAYRPQPNTLISKIGNYANTSTITPGASAVTGAGMKSISTAGYNELLNTVDSQLSSITNDIKIIDDEIAKVQRSRFTLNKNRKLNQLNKKKELLQQSHAQIDDLAKGLRTGTRVGDAVHIDNSVFSKASELHTKTSNLTSQNRTRWARRGGFAAGFVRGFVCGFLGIGAGNNFLKSSGKTELNYSIDFEENIIFERNKAYEVYIDYQPVEANEYESRYIVSIRPLNEVNENFVNVQTSKRVDECVAPSN